MTKENLILTIGIGEYHQKISELTLPSIKKYAKRIGADFKIITEANPLYEADFFSGTQRMLFQKCAIYDLLTQYKRILYLDIDLIVREDCPSLFDIVPSDKLGVMNEAVFGSRIELVDAANQFGEPLKKWDGKFYNTGVMVISRMHRPLFKFPTHNRKLGEQAYFNLRISNDGIKIKELDWRFNRMSIMDTFIGKSRLESYIVHYAGAPPNQIFPTIQNDIEQWKLDIPDYNYPHNILIRVSAGMGDQYCAEPAIRYTQKVYPDANIYVVTHFPRLFEHLEVPVISYDNWKGLQDAVYTMYTCPDDEKSNHKLSHVLFHPTDFASMSMIRRTIPNHEKTFKVKLHAEEIGSVIEMTKDKPKDKPLILVHPGRWWPSKTFPTEWWQEVVNKLSEKLCVGLIGKHIDEKQGYLPIECPKDGIDFRDLTTLGELISLISLTKCTLTNDSSPLHLAGAFNNWIVVIPTCKHPDHILPFRHGTQYYKTKALYKRLLLDDLEIRHTEFNPDTIDTIPAGKTLYDYIPDVGTVVDEVFDIYETKEDEVKSNLML